MQTDAANAGASSAAQPGSDPALAFNLPQSLDLTAADRLHATLQGMVARDCAVLLDGSGVERASTVCLQLLVAASAASRGRGLAFRVASPSASLRNAAQDLGLCAALGMEAA